MEFPDKEKKPPDRRIPIEEASMAMNISAFRKLPFVEVNVKSPGGVDEVDIGQCPFYLFVALTASREPSLVLHSLKSPA